MRRGMKYAIYYGILHTLPHASYCDLVGLLVQGKADDHIEIVFDFSNDLSPGSRKFGMHPGDAQFLHAA